MDDDLKQNLTAGETWIRGLFILLFAFLLFIARIVTAAVVVIQFLFTVFSGQTNRNLKTLGANLSQYIYQCLRFLTYNSDTRPFPFNDWPEGEAPSEEKPVTEKPKAAAKPTSNPKPGPKVKAKAKAKTKSKTATDTGSGTESKSEG